MAIEMPFEVSIINKLCSNFVPEKESWAISPGITFSRVVAIPRGP